MVEINLKRHLGLLPWVCANKSFFLPDVFLILAFLIF